MSVISCPRCGKADQVFARNGTEFFCLACFRAFTAGSESAEPGWITSLLTATTEAPQHIFLSYAHAQDEIVRRIYDALVSRGHTVWFDHENIRHDDNWRQKIIKGLTESNGVLSFLSREAVRPGGVCLDELSIAVGVKYGNIHTVLLQKEKDVQPPSYLTHRQWLDMSDWQEHARQGGDHYNLWLREKIAMIIQAVENPESRDFAGKITAIREKLRLEDIAISRQRWYLQRAFVGRKWLTAAIEQWLEDPAGGRLMAVYGGPGTGKSAFAAQYAYYNRRVAASVFFEHGNPHFNNATALIKELAFQLACRIPGYRDILHLRLTEDDRILSLSDQELFEKLLAVPLSQHTIDGGHETLCIVVDGLDECTDNERNSAAELLGYFAPRLPGWLRLLVLSRSDAEVTASLLPNATLTLSGTDEENRADLRLYLEERLASLLAGVPDASHLLDEMTARANGVFLYAETLTDMILRGELDISDPEQYPADLSHSFRLWFSRCFPDDGVYRRLYRPWLGMIAAAPEPLPTEDLDGFRLRYDPDEDRYEVLPPDGLSTPVHERLRRLDSFLIYRENAFRQRTVSFSHRYFTEWLTGLTPEGHPRAHRFHANAALSLRLLTRAWTQRLEQGTLLTAYQALFLLPCAIAADGREKAVTIAETAGLGEQLVAYHDRFEKEMAYDLMLKFSEAEVDRRRVIADVRKTDAAELNYAMSLVQYRDDLYDLGKHTEAKESCEQTIHIMKRILGEEHRFTLNAMENLTLILDSLGRYAESRRIGEALLEPFVRVFGPAHENTICAKLNLAATYTSLGLVTQAIELTEQLLLQLQSQSQTLSDQTIEAMNTLSIAYAEIDKLDDAIAIKKQVVEQWKARLGPSHPKTLSAIATLSSILCSAGNLESALEFGLDAYQECIAVLGSSHPVTITATSNLSAIYQKMGDYEKSLYFAKASFNMAKVLYGQSHPETLATQNNLAVFLMEMGLYHEAHPLLEQSLAVAKEVYPENHDKIITSMNNLAVLYINMKQLTHAAQLLEQIIQIRATTEYRDTERAADEMINLVYLFMELEQFEDCIPLLEQCIRICSQSSHTFEKLQNAKRCLATVHMELGNQSLALPLLEEVYVAVLDTPAQSYSEAIDMLHMVSSAYTKMKQHEKSIAIEERILKHHINHQNGICDDAVACRANIALSFVQLRRYGYALELMEHAYELSRKNHGEHHPDTKKYKGHLFDIRFRLSFSS